MWLCMGRYAKSNMQKIKYEIFKPDWSGPGVTQLPPVLLANRVPVEAVLVLAEDRGRRKDEGVLGGSRREGTAGIWR